MGATEVEMRGTNFMASLRALRVSRGEAARDDFLEALEGEVGAALRLGGLVSAGWYPVGWWRSYLASLDALLGGREALAEAGRLSARQDLAVLFRYARMVLRPEVAGKQVRYVHGRYMRGGSAEAVEARPGRLRIAFRGNHGFDARCWADYLGGVKGVLEGLGAVGPALEVRGGGGPDCDAVFTWPA